MEEKLEARVRELTDKWVRRLGLGVHPDTRGKDYTPKLSPSMVRAYEADLDELFTLGDPYADFLAAWQRAGLV